MALLSMSELMTSKLIYLRCQTLVNLLRLMQIKQKCKSAVRSICVLDPQTLIIGENEGWFELIRVSSNIDLVEVILSRKFDAVGHVFTLQMTIEPYQIVVCSYTGVHFIQMKSDDKTLTMQLFLCDLSYETE